jgi:hypothetical protein
MKKENVNLIMLLCLLLSFCSGFTSCGDDDEEEYNPCGSFEVVLEKADAVYLESNTLYGITNMEGGLILQKVNGKKQILIRYQHQDGSELYFNPVNLPESLFLDYSFSDSFGTVGNIRFSGEVMPRLEGMEYTPIVLTYAKISLSWFNL